MQDQQPQSRRIPLAVIVGISTAVFAAGGGTALWTWKSAQPPTPTTQATTAQIPTTATSPKPQSSQSVPEPSVQPAAKNVAQIYWLKDTGKSFDLVASSIPQKATDKPNDVLQDAFKRLLAGSTDPNLSSTIPKGTKLRGVKVSADGVHVDLSEEFTSGGGSDSMTGRLAQVVYTATSLNPEGKVWINVDGKKLEVLGGEGLEVEQPTTRSKFQKDFKL